MANSPGKLPPTLFRESSQASGSVRVAAIFVLLYNDLPWGVFSGLLLTACPSIFIGPHLLASSLPCATCSLWALLCGGLGWGHSTMTALIMEMAFFTEQ